MPWKKIFIVVGLLFLVWVFKDPPAAAAFAKDVWNEGDDAVDSVITFFSALFS